MFRAALARDRDGVFEAARQIGYFKTELSDEQKELVLDIILMATEPFREDGAFDFAASDLPIRLSEAGMELSMERDYWHTPPADALFLHRKLGGLFMLASRLKARVNLHELVQVHL